LLAKRLVPSIFPSNESHHEPRKATDSCETQNAVYKEGKYDHLKETLDAWIPGKRPDKKP